GEIAQNLERLDDHPVRRRAIERRDEADTAGVVLVARIVKTLAWGQRHDRSITTLTRCAKTLFDGNHGVFVTWTKQSRSAKPVSPSVSFVSCYQGAETSAPVRDHRAIARAALGDH